MLFLLTFILLYLPIKLFMPTKVIGKKNLPKNKQTGYILCANHYSNFDVILLDISLGKKINYLAKKELFKNKFFGGALTKLGAIKIDRENADVVAFKNAMNILKNKKPLGIFPEGTRNKNLNATNMNETKDGAIIFAGKSGVPIIPTAIAKRPKFFSRNKIIIGDPFYVEAVNPKKMTKEEISANSQKLAEIINTLHLQILSK